MFLIFLAGVAGGFTLGYFLLFVVDAPYYVRWFLNDLAIRRHNRNVDRIKREAKKL
jgi:hypothetical protein